MKLATYFFNNGRLLALVLALILVAGGSSIAILPRMEDPVLAKRVGLINAPLPGADASRVETLITEKLEDQLRDIEEIKELRSVSRVGMGTISIELRDEVTDTDPVWSRVRSRIEDALPRLPAEAPRPSFEEMEVRAYALIVGVCDSGAAVSDRPANIRLIRRLAIDLQDRLQNLPGTDKVDRYGDPGEEIEVTVDPPAAAAVGLNPQQIAAQIAANDAKGTAGQLRDGSMRVPIEVGNQLDAVEQIAGLVLTRIDNRDVTVGDVATIRVGVPNPPAVAAVLEAGEAVVLGVMVRPATRIDHWTVQAEAVIDEWKKSLPVEVSVDTVLRQENYVAERLGSLVANLVMGAAAVAGVIFLMMGARSAVIVTLTLPLASLMVLFALRAVGIPIHQMSVTGLIIALGLLIDNAIVVVDEVRGRLGRGRSPVDAMSGSVGHLAVPLLGSTLTTALAFAPIALMPGPAGEFVGSIAISVIFAVTASFFLALSVIPTIAARFLTTSPAGVRAWYCDGIAAEWMTRIGRASLRWLLMRPWRGVAVALVLPALGFAFAGTLSEQFFPPAGRNQFHVTIERPATSELSATRETAEKADAILRRGGAARVDWFFGESAPPFYYNVVANRRGTANFAQGLVTLQPDARPGDVIGQMQIELAEALPSSRVLVRQLEQGPPFEAPVEVRLFGPDLDTLRELGFEVRRRLSAVPQVAAVRTDLVEVLPQLAVEVDAEAAAGAGLTPADVSAQLATALQGRAGGSVLQDNEQLPVVVRVGGADRGQLGRIETMDLVLPASGQSAAATTPLSAIARVSLRPQAAAIPRLDRQRMNEVNAYLRVGVLPSTVQALFEQSLINDPMRLPPGYSIRYGGEASKRDDAVGNLFSTVGVLGVLMAATLVLSFGSFRLAGVIGLVAVLSVGLGLGSLELTGYPFGFMAIIGTMGLIGVAINDSIVVLASLRSNSAAVGGDLDATVGEVMHCVRHVLATTLTTMAGFAPLILDGGAFWPPMAISIAGGVAGATLLALVLVPALHYWIVSDRPGRQMSAS